MPHILSIVQKHKCIITLGDGKMKIKKKTFKDKQVWLAIYSDKDEYLGTWHIVHPEFAQAVRDENPLNIKIR